MMEIDEHRFGPIANFAASLLLARQENYPLKVDRGQMTREDAHRGIAIATALTEIWSAAFECRLPDPAKLGTVDRCDIVCDLFAYRDQLETTLATDPDNRALQRHIGFVTAMINWHRRFVEGPIWCVRITLQLRKHEDAAKAAA